MEILTKFGVSTLTWNASTSPRKVGRQGYALFLVNSGMANIPWFWRVEDQSGHQVATSDLYFRSKWDAKRSAYRLTDKIKHIYVEDANGSRTREL